MVKCDPAHRSWLLRPLEETLDSFSHCCVGEDTPEKRWLNDTSQRLRKQYLLFFFITGIDLKSACYWLCFSVIQSAS